MDMFSKKTPAQVFSSEICEIFKNTFFYRTPLVAASSDAWFLRRFPAYSVHKSNPTLSKIIIFFFVGEEKNSFFRTVIIVWSEIKNTTLVWHQINFMSYLTA